MSRRRPKLIVLSEVRAGIADIRCCGYQHLSRRELVRMHLELASSRSWIEGWEVFRRWEENEVHVP